MNLLIDLTIMLYVMGTIFLVIFVSGFGVLLLIYLLTRRNAPSVPHVAESEMLSVTVQLPIYNEPEVVDRLIDACVRMNFPEGKLRIQVLDDSTDCTTARIREKIRRLRSQGFQHIEHIYRPQRWGYKAGALADGLKRIETDCVVIFDADFVPESDFLCRTMPFFHSQPRLGLIQTRWSHLNSDYNLLTRAQALNIDAHFGVEQVARSRGHLPMAMNGTGGIWRVDAIEDAGGWSDATLTEDLDLSYRAYMRGWEFLYLVDVAVPGELPPLVQSYKTQQARWAIGSTQCLIRHARALVMAKDFSLLEKLMGLLHLAQYAVQPVILLLFLLTPMLIYTGSIGRLPNLTLLASIGIIPPVVIALGQFELYEDWRRRLVYFPVQLVAAVAIVLNNSWAVLMALHQGGSGYEFKRTPKFRLSGREDRITHEIQIDLLIVGELILALYASFGVFVALRQAPGVAPYMLTYALSFYLFAFWNLHQVWYFNRRSGSLATGLSGD